MVVELPIDSVLPEIVQKLSANGSLVLKAEPGAGKTTRVPPALLDAGLAQLSDGTPGQIVVLQPRRIAARAAAVRICDERGTALGAEVGYQVRHEKRASAATRILVCTEGIFLRKLQDDPLLESVAIVVFDEFHERNLDGDLALAMARQVKLQVRDDLRIVVMSATLDSKPICDYLGGAPAVESAGRRYPVEIDYLQFAPPASMPLARTVTDAVSQVVPNSESHVLVFLPGVGEIMNVAESLRGIPSFKDFLIMPLYGDLALEEQQEVLRATKRRKIILSTNVAETSLTIDGVTSVIDSGLARVNRFHQQLGFNRLELERISKASAEQRAGRAGRTAPGRCLRLWTERDQFALRDFDEAEIMRVELSQCALQLIAWGETNVREFPFFQAPPEQPLETALTLLDLLDALQNGKLTATGREMADLPLQPRIARMLLEAKRLHASSRRSAICAALLSERDPFRREDRFAYQRQHHSHSDLLDRARAIENFEQRKERESFVGSISPGAAKQVLRAAQQLESLVGASSSHDSADDRPLLRAIVSAFPDRICKRRSAAGHRAVMVGGRGVRLSEESAVADADLFAAIELHDAGKAETTVRQASLVERTWLSEHHIRTSVEVQYDASRQKVVAFKRTRYADIVLDEMPGPMPADVDVSSVLAEGIRQNLDVASLVDEEAKQYLARIACLRQHVPALGMPDFGDSPWLDLLPDWCFACTSVSDLSVTGLIAAIQSRLSPAQITAVESEAPGRITMRSGRKFKIAYEPGKPPVLAVRIQELFGTASTPLLASGRIPLLLHLLAPNYRVQQITPDLASFWKNTYPDVRKELKRRYPKHAWPEDPITPS